MKVIGGKAPKRSVAPKIRCIASALAACTAVSFFTAGAVQNSDRFWDRISVAAAGFVFPEGILPTTSSSQKEIENVIPEQKESGQLESSGQSSSLSSEGSDLSSSENGDPSSDISSE